MMLFVVILDLLVNMEIMCDMDGFMDVMDCVYSKVILMIFIIFFFGSGCVFINEGFRIVKMFFFCVMFMFVFERKYK